MAKKMACSLGSCGRRTPSTREPAGPRPACPMVGPQPHSLLPGVSGLHSAEGLGRSRSYGLEASHLGGKVKAARAPHRREPTHATEECVQYHGEVHIETICGDG